MTKCCPWADPNSDFDPEFSSKPNAGLCRSHYAEWMCASLDGLDRMEAAERADMANLGYFDR